MSNNKTRMLVAGQFGAMLAANQKPESNINARDKGYGQKLKLPTHSKLTPTQKKSKQKKRGKR